MYFLDFKKSLEKSGTKEIDNHLVRVGTGKKSLLKRILAISASLYLCLSATRLSYLLDSTIVSHRSERIGFYYNLTRPRISCVMKDGHPTSFSGTIGLIGDSDKTPKRSFFWYFEAENNPQDASIVLSIGGGPGASGMLPGVNGQSRCTVTASSTLEYNPDGWSENFNLILLDHPTNVGYSYGARVNNSHDAALDAYDFLQKFFRLFPKLRKNKVVLSSGSYGGIYIPNIVHVIHENNKAILNGTTNSRRNFPINLDSIMISNPISEPFVYHEWLLEYRCNMHQVYNATMCRKMFSNLPKCLEAIELAYQYPNVYYRALAEETCYKYVGHIPSDVVLEDVRRKCKTTPDDPARCHPLFVWSDTYFRNESTKHALGLTDNREFFGLNQEVEADFAAYGDRMQRHQDLLIPAMNDNIRVLHYVGAQDASCSWPGVFSSGWEQLKQLRSSYQTVFLSAPDVLWDSGLNQKVVIRQVGEGAGNFTYMLIDEAGHFVAHDQPRLAKKIAEHWILNIPFFNVSDSDQADTLEIEP